jgi:hypothetical protein
MASTEFGPDPQAGSLRQRQKISEDGRRLLREAAAAQGLDVVIGNKIADWLDTHPNAQVSISGKTPEPPLRVFGTGVEPEDATE